MEKKNGAESILFIQVKSALVKFEKFHPGGNVNTFQEKCDPFCFFFDNLLNFTVFVFVVGGENK